MTFDIEKERHEFEGWVTDGGNHPEMIQKTRNGSYAVMSTYLYWQAWEERAKRDNAVSV